MQKNKKMDIIFVTIAKIPHPPDKSNPKTLQMLG
jgi:hypothetical protein